MNIIKYFTTKLKGMRYLVEKHGWKKKIKDYVTGKELRISSGNTWFK